MTDKQKDLWIQSYEEVQGCAKEVMCELADSLCPGMTEKQIARKCGELFQQKGIVNFWYYGIAALVLVGRRTTLSVSGKDYTLTDEPVRGHDIISVDLSPQIGSIWGDYARTIFIRNGKACLWPDSQDKDYLEGFALEEKLHKTLLETAKPEMTAHDLWGRMNAVIVKHGFENLDFKGNLGHSIEKDMAARCYIEEGNERKLADFRLFTFEPHIRKVEGLCGFKHENIYYFADNKLFCL